METKKKSWLALLNPFNWLFALFEPILLFLGLMPHPNTEGFENLSKADVDEAAEDAKRTEEAIDAIMKEMSPAEVVKAYAAACPEDRALIDLSALGAEGEDWLHSLSEDDLTLLSMSTTAGCARSLEARAVKPIYPRPAAETEKVGIFRIPTLEDVEEEKRAFVAARYRELFHAPGIANTNPRYVPSGTVH